MAYDFKREYRQLYLPGQSPMLITVPRMNFAAVRGEGDPNEEGGAYKEAVGLLYGVLYTIRMSGRSGHEIDGFFEFVVPPLEGFWQQGPGGEIDCGRKEDFRWISAIRLPDFVGEQDLRLAAEEAGRKKRRDYSAVEFLSVEEGLCVQCMHIGPFDEEPGTVARMDRFLEENGYENDMGEGRMHHEIYLSDPRRVPPQRLKTVIRHPVRERRR